jgi:hypothetical protein
MTSRPGRTHGSWCLNRLHNAPAWNRRSRASLLHVPQTRTCICSSRRPTRALVFMR